MYSYFFLENGIKKKREEIWAVAKDILMMLFGIFALFVTDKSCQGLKDHLGKTYIKRHMYQNQISLILA